MRTPDFTSLSGHALTILEEIKSMNGNEELIFVDNYNPRNPMINRALNGASLRVTSYDDGIEIAITASARWRVIRLLSQDYNRKIWRESQ